MKLRITIAFIISALTLDGGIWVYRRIGQLQEYGPVARRLSAELAAARRERVPLTVADIRPQNPIPDSKNAARIFRQIDKQYRAIPEAVKQSEGDVSKLARSTDKSDRERARAILRGRADLMALAEKAAARLECRFDRPWEKGPEVMLPELATLRALARYFSARALLQSRQRDLPGAFKSIQIGSRIGYHAGDDPILIGMLVNVAINAIMDRAFTEILLQNCNDPAALKLARSVAQFPEMRPLEHSMAGEAVMCRICVDIVRNRPSQAEQLLARIGRRKAKTRLMIADAWETRMLEYWRECFRKMRETPNDPVAQAKVQESLGNDIIKRDKQPAYELAAILMPVFSQAALRLAGAHELQRLRKTLISLVANKQETGQWPVSLNDLKEPVETNIFTGKPPIYRRTADGFILYSVGEDLRDDGGLQTRDPKLNPVTSLSDSPS